MERRLREKLVGGVFRNVSPTRSRIMSRIRSQHTRSTEGAIRMALVRAGARGWRLHAGELPGNPDIYFPKQKVAVFVDGCFWHGCPRCGHIPKNNRAFWRAKILRNRQRDHLAVRKLSSMGIKTLRFWEHSFKNADGAAAALAAIEQFLHAHRKRAKRCSDQRQTDNNRNR